MPFSFVKKGGSDIPKTLMDTTLHTLTHLSQSLFTIKANDPQYNFLIQILNEIHESVLIIDTDTTVLFVNESYLKAFRVQRERIIGKHLKNFEPLAKIHEVLKNKTPITGNISHIYSAKKDIHADMIPLFSQGTLVGAMALMRDVTDFIQVSRELEHFKNLSRKLKKELNGKEDLPPAFRHVIGNDRRFVHMLHTAARAAQSDAAICIMGESGTGKEVLVESIHGCSQRSCGPLIKINCAAIPANLLESELFGYESGAFTGAKTGGKPGKFELASGGTIFLDEIGEMPLSMQVKLLRVLQDKKVERIGGEQSIDLNFRLITATNRDLEAMIEKGEFREDLYYRINVIGLTIPPLRERTSDIEQFAQFFLDELCQRYHRNFRFTKEALYAITNYHWPGNVRELKNYVERAAILSYDDRIGLEDLPTRVKNRPDSVYVKPDDSHRLHEILETAEREAIIEALHQTGGNKTQAIELLGISRRCFYQKLNKYQILHSSVF